MEVKYTTEEAIDALGALSQLQKPVPDGNGAEFCTHALRCIRMAKEVITQLVDKLAEEEDLDDLIDEWNRFSDAADVADRRCHQEAERRFAG